MPCGDSNYYGSLLVIQLSSHLISVRKCPTLTVSRLVKTSPNGCVTSQMKINTKCSFSCPQGYQLQGPSYKQCGSSGQWSDSAKTVSCIGEVNYYDAYKMTIKGNGFNYLLIKINAKNERRFDRPTVIFNFNIKGKKLACAYIQL